jgi:hypothetical protein
MTTSTTSTDDTPREDAPPTPPTPPPPLAYAPRPRRGRAGFVALGVVVAALAVVGWRWRGPLIDHARMLAAQRACATHTFAPDARVASSNGPPRFAAAPPPACWTACQAAAVVPTNAPLAAGPNAAFARSLAFLHRRRSPGGVERIVAVQCFPLYLTSASVVQAFQAVTVEPAPAWPVSRRPVRRDGPFNGGFPVRAAVVVFGGQADAADPSHFTIAYTVDGRPGTIDGWLRDDETVVLKVRPGSADVYPRPANAAE